MLKHAYKRAPAYPIKPPVHAAVDYPPPPPPLLSSGGAPAPSSFGMSGPSVSATRPLGSQQPFTANLGARQSPAAPSHFDVAPVVTSGGSGGQAGVAPLGQPRPFTSSTSITIGLSGGGGGPPPAAGTSVGLAAAAKPFGGAPSAAVAAPALPKVPLPAGAQASTGVQQPPFGARASELPSAGTKASIDLSFAVSPGSSKDAGGVLSTKLTAPPSVSAGNVTVRPFVQPLQQQQHQQQPSLPNASAGNAPVRPFVQPAQQQPSQPPKTKTSPEAEVDSLTDLLIHNLEVAKDSTCLGICAHCNKKIAADSAMCTAMEKSYHIECFACYSCKKLLTGQSFYLVRNEPQCEACYTASLEKCSACQQPITDRILRATGKAYHARCFTCVVCHRSLDGVPFTVDSDNQVHCVEDFHKKYAPRCSVCQQPIMPEGNQEETVRIVALDRNFHISCYKCEDCGLLLSSEADGRGCYPLDGHVLCRSCNSKRVFEKTTGGHQYQQPPTVPASDF